MQHGLDRDEALAHVADHRPMAGPEVGAQRELVDELAACSKGGPVSTADAPGHSGADMERQLLQVGSGRAP